MDISSSNSFEFSGTVAISMKTEKEIIKGHFKIKILGCMFSKIKFFVTDLSRYP